MSPVSSQSSSTSGDQARRPHRRADRGCPPLRGPGRGDRPGDQLRPAEHKVIFFSGQDHLDDAGQYEFASLLGMPTTAAPDGAPAAPGVLPINSDHGKANSWHTDVTFVDRVPASAAAGGRAARLRRHHLWANTVTAYERCPRR